MKMGIAQYSHNNISDQFFNPIFSYIDQQNEYCQLRSHIEQYVTVYYDDLQTLVAVDTVPNISNPYIDRFRSLSPEERVAVFTADSLPIFPITDTLFIVDTNNFSDEESVVFNKHNYIRTHYVPLNVPMIKCLFLNKIRVSDYIIILFSFYNSKVFYIFRLDLEKEHFNVKRAYRTDISIPIDTIPGNFYR